MVRSAFGQAIECRRAVTDHRLRLCRRSAWQRLIALGHSVTGIRDDEQNNRLAKLGIHPLNLDITEAGALDRLEESFDHVVVAVSLARGRRRINVSSERHSECLRMAETHTAGQPCSSAAPASTAKQKANGSTKNRTQQWTPPRVRHPRRRGSNRISRQPCHNFTLFRYLRPGARLPVSTIHKRGRNHRRHRRTIP